MGRPFVRDVQRNTLFDADIGHLAFLASLLRTALGVPGGYRSAGGWDSGGASAVAAGDASLAERGGAGKGDRGAAVGGGSGARKRGAAAELCRERAGLCDVHDRPGGSDSVLELRRGADDGL